MLLVGAWQHGFGNWEKIQDNPELGPSQKVLPQRWQENR